MAPILVAQPVQHKRRILHRNLRLSYTMRSTAAGADRGPT
jgi:hypothetical protein